MSPRPVAASLCVLLLAACARRAPASTTPAVAPRAQPPAGESPTSGEEARAPLTRSELGTLFTADNDARTQAILAGIGIKYLGENALAGTELAGASARTDNGLQSCPQFFASELRDGWYEVSGERYYIDAMGRPAQAYTELPPIAPDQRNESCQGKVGGWGDATGTGDYDGGHMIGRQLGGFGGRLNMVPQEGNLNKGNWKSIEDHVAKHCTVLPARSLRYWPSAAYSEDTSIVPITMSIYLEDKRSGDSIEVTFQNERLGGRDGAEMSDAAIEFLKRIGCN